MNLINLIIISLASIMMQEPNQVSRNNMEVSWKYDAQRIWIEMSAPTDGWLAIGFNESQEITGNYLLMGRVRDGRAELVEYRTIAAGNYQSITQLGGSIQIADVEGEESGDTTSIKFSLPLEAVDRYRKDLTQGNEYVLLLAFSREDDFQHHSMMRTSIEINL
ncbi:MAG: DOMON domain-containing protein [Bacteroidia bacterium]